jgi:hypothetical protein
MNQSFEGDHLSRGPRCWEWSGAPGGQCGFMLMLVVFATSRMFNRDDFEVRRFMVTVDRTRGAYAEAGVTAVERSVSAVWGIPVP